MISAISERGLRNRTPAHTPSLSDNRWLSHRSMPFAGTSTNSSAKGSGAGSASSRASPSASMSVRSARRR
ncbi:Uncharacterised protein [Mycobacteroides abscessus subsp. abscessus]|nr:Uncharacterised protein [Mycobacteroides abscessus subsp. abscessus]